MANVGDPTCPRRLSRSRPRAERSPGAKARRTTAPATEEPEADVKQVIGHRFALSGYPPLRLPSSLPNFSTSP